MPASAEIPRQKTSTWRTDCVGSVHAGSWMVVVAETHAWTYIIVTDIVQVGRKSMSCVLFLMEIR